MSRVVDASTVAGLEQPRVVDSARAPRAHATAGPLLAIGPLPPPYHGVATAMEQVVALRDFGTSVVVLDTADRRGLDNIGKIDLQNVYLAFRHGFQFLWLLATRRPSVVSLYISQGALPFLRDFLFLAPARLTRRRLIVHLQGGYFRRFYDDSPGLLRWVIRWSLQGADRVIVLGERFRSFFDGLVPPERVVVLPNAVDPAPYDELRARLPQRDAMAGGPVVLYLATISEAKGALDLLRAVPEIRRRVPDARVVICGEVESPTAQAEMERILTAEGLRDTVELGGVATGERKLRLLLESDLFVFPSKYPYEGHPFVVLEAMAAGLPIVTTDHACIADTIVDGQNGFLVPKGSPPAISEAVVRLLKDPVLRERFGRANLARLREYYTLDVWQRRFAELVRDVQAGA